MRLRAAADPRIDPVAPVAEPGLQNVFVPQRSASRFGQITTSLERLLALIRPVLDCTGAATLLHGLLRSVGETDSAMAGLMSVEPT